MSPPAGSLLGPVELGTLDPGACAKDRLGTPGADVLRGTRLGDNLFGLQGDDVLNGERHDDCLFGGVGADRLIGAQGDDRLLGDDSETGIGGDDRLLGNAGNDLLIGGAGRDRISGGAGNDRLRGGPGRNRLRGGPGNDRLNGVNGKPDRLLCGRGRDRARADSFDRRARLRASPAGGRDGRPALDAAPELPVAPGRRPGGVAAGRREQPRAEPWAHASARSARAAARCRA